MRQIKSAVVLTTITLAISMATTTNVSAQFPTAGWLKRATGGRFTTPRPIQNMTPFQVRPAPTSTFPGESVTPGWRQPGVRPITVGGNQSNRRPNANITIHAGTQRKSLYSIKNNGRVYRGNQQVGRAHRTNQGWIALGPGATFIQKNDGSTRTKVRSAGSLFK